MASAGRPQIIGGGAPITKSRRRRPQNDGGGEARPAPISTPSMMETYVQTECSMMVHVTVAEGKNIITAGNCVWKQPCRSFIHRPPFPVLMVFSKEGGMKGGTPKTQKEIQTRHY